jgi:hypothetical protein
VPDDGGEAVDSKTLVLVPALSVALALWSPDAAQAELGPASQLRRDRFTFRSEVSNDSPTCFIDSTLRWIPSENTIEVQTHATGHRECSEGEATAIVSYENLDGRIVTHTVRGWRTTAEGTFTDASGDGAVSTHRVYFATGDISTPNYHLGWSK